MNKQEIAKLLKQYEHAIVRQIGGSQQAAKDIERLTAQILALAN